MTDKKPSDRGAVLQMEIDLSRWTNIADADFASKYSGESPWDRLFYIVRTAAGDTIRNGGTLVLIREGNTVTIVQRPKEAK